MKITALIFIVFMCLTGIIKAQNFKTIKVGNSIWMAENLNREVKGSYYYQDDVKNGLKYGRLYTYDAALHACPNGWHLPNESEWDQLIENTGGSDMAGLMLKSGGNSGLNLQLGGFSNVGGFMLLNSYGAYWSSTSQSITHAWYIFFSSADNLATKSYFNKGYGLSVRCVKD